MEHTEDAGWEPTRIRTDGREVIPEKVKDLVDKVGTEII